MMLNDGFLKVVPSQRRSALDLDSLEYKPEGLCNVFSRLGGLNPEGVMEFLALMGWVAGGVFCVLVFFFFA